MTKIGIDIDGVLGDFIGQVIRVAKSKYDLEIRREQITTYDISSSTDLTAKQVKEIVHDNETYLPAKPLACAAETLQTLRANGHEVHIVTARPEHLIGDTQTWLANNEFSFDEFANVSGKQKANYAKKNGIDIFVEDCLETALDLAKVCRSVLLINTSYNQGDTPANIIRMPDWSLIKYVMTGCGKEM